MKDIQLSENFKLSEMIFSTTAEIEHIDNTPTQQVIDNLRILCREVLQQARNDYGKMHVNSGYRCKALNKAVGGKANSYHLTGQAADIYADNFAKGNYLSSLLLRASITDLVILEHRGKKWWVHVQWSYSPRHRYISNYEG